MKPTDFGQIKNNISDSRKSIYKFHSAKKIYLTRTTSQYLLVEKDDDISRMKSLSLSTRDTIVTSSNNGIMIFPKDR